MSCSTQTTDADANLGEPNSKKAKTDDGTTEDLPETAGEEEEEAEAGGEVAEEEDEPAVADAAEHEESLGIAERINKDNKRFRGVLKQITADFIVNEIDLDNQVVYLNDLSEPRAPDQEQTNQSESVKPPSSQQECEQAMKQILGEVKYQELVDFLGSNTSTSSFRIEAPKDKLDRKRVHDFFKTFHKTFTSNTVNEVSKETKQTQQIIEICHQKYQRSSMKDCFRPTGNSDASRLLDRFKVVECCLYKENIDTIQAVNLIAKHLRISSKRIGIAGTKDKRAVTTQMISLFKVDAKQVLALNGQFHNIKLGNLKLKKDGGLKLGDLSGNRFKLTIREIDETDDELIRGQIEAFKSNGFINYFGLQRFGNSNQVPTHSIGKCLIQNRIREAIELILKPRDDSKERDDVRKAREIWFNNRDEALKAYVQIQRVNCIEKCLLNGLVNSCKNDFLGALQYLPRNMRTMYLHAYQSYIWNMAITKRVQLYGLKPQIGDLVRNKIEQKRLKNQKFNAARKSGGSTIGVKGESDEESEAIYLTEANIATGYTIHDVVLPLPGYDVLYPKNDIKAYYEEILASDGLDLDSFRNKIKDFSLSGDYRCIVTKPGDVNYQIKYYKDNEKPLAKTDWDLLNKTETSDCLDSEAKGDKKALIIEFNLPSSAYATMALRELLLN